MWKGICLFDGRPRLLQLSAVCTSCLLLMCLEFDCVWGFVGLVPIFSSLTVEIDVSERGQSEYDTVDGDILNGQCGLRRHALKPPCNVSGSTSYRSVGLSVYLSVCLSICLSVCLSVCLPACLPACLPVCLSVCLSVCPPACTCVYTCVCMYESFFNFMYMW